MMKPEINTEFEPQPRESGLSGLGFGVGFLVAAYVGFYYWHPYVLETFGKPKKLGVFVYLPLFLIPFIFQIGFEFLILGFEFLIHLFNFRPSKRTQPKQSPAPKRDEASQVRMGFYLMVISVAVLAVIATVFLLALFGCLVLFYL